MLGPSLRMNLEEKNESTPLESHVAEQPGFASNLCFLHKMMIFLMFFSRTYFYSLKL